MKAGYGKTVRPVCAADIIGRLLRPDSGEAGVTPVERREQAIAIRFGSTGNGRNPIIEWKAAAFAWWHEPDESRGSSPDL
jgi:hypothetical protein